MKQDQLIGGQAVMEGVMMRNRESMVVACRNPEGVIKVVRQKISPLADRYPFLGWFLIRGIIVFFESLALGVKSLNISTEQALESEGEKISPVHTFISVFLGLAMGVGLFFLLPTFLISFLPQLFPVLTEYHVLLNLLEGLLRITIFVSYILLISLWDEIKGVFSYHGAEHKAIHCFESGDELVTEKAGKYSVQHPRCGTSYLLIVMIISILVFSFFGWPSPWLRFLIRLALLPVIAGIAYEAIRWTASSSFKGVKYLTYPGLWLQKLTTCEPHQYQLEVALTALKALIGEEEKQAQVEEDDVLAGET